jgi:hypothetical protein
MNAHGKAAKSPVVPAMCRPQTGSSRYFADFSSQVPAIRNFNAQSTFSQMFRPRPHAALCNLHPAFTKPAWYRGFLTRTAKPNFFFPLPGTTIYPFGPSQHFPQMFRTQPHSALCNLHPAFTKPAWYRIFLRCTAKLIFLSPSKPETRNSPPFSTFPSHHDSRSEHLSWGNQFVAGLGSPLPDLTLFNPFYPHSLIAFRSGEKATRFLPLNAQRSTLNLVLPSQVPAFTIFTPKNPTPHFALRISRSGRLIFPKC